MELYRSKPASQKEPFPPTTQVYNPKAEWGMNYGYKLPQKVRESCNISNLVTSGNCTHDINTNITCCQDGAGNVSCTKDPQKRI